MDWRLLAEPEVGVGVSMGGMNATTMSRYKYCQHCRLGFGKRGLIMQASRFFYNGLEQARVAGSSDASSPTNVAEIASIGKSTTGSNFANVKISELIVLNDSSEASRRGIETYLARKWGLTYTQPTSDGIFELDSNGTLKSLVSLDRETVATLPITVRATDPTGNFIEQSFSVTVEDDGLEDTDGDGFLDSIEITSGSDENNATSLPSDFPAFWGKQPYGWMLPMLISNKTQHFRTEIPLINGWTNRGMVKTYQS